MKLTINLFFSLLFVRFLQVLPNHTKPSDKQLLNYNECLLWRYESLFLHPYNRQSTGIPKGLAADTKAEMLKAFNDANVIPLGIERTLTLKKNILVFQANIQRGYSKKIAKTHPAW